MGVFAYPGYVKMAIFGENCAMRFPTVDFKKHEFFMKICKFRNFKFLSIFINFLHKILKNSEK